VCSLLPALCRFHASRISPAVSVDASSAFSLPMISAALSPVTPVYGVTLWPNVSTSMPSSSHLLASLANWITFSFRYSMRVMPLGQSLVAIEPDTSTPKMKLSPLLSSRLLGLGEAACAVAVFMINPFMHVVYVGCHRRDESTPPAFNVNKK